MPLKAIRISQQGYLSLQRKDKFDLCFCPFASKNMTIRCGAWCPHLGEPGMGEHYPKICITCGHGSTLEAEVIYDDRNQG